MPLTPESLLRDAIVQALGELGGAAQRRDVLAQVELILGLSFTEADRLPVASRPFEQRWMNNASYAREHMKGDLLTVRNDGVWQLAEAGWSRFGELERTRSQSESDLLSDFYPKDSSEYTAWIRGRVLVKSREHESLIGDFGREAASSGYAVSTRVHPRDLVLSRSTSEFLVEAKALHAGNATQAVREAVAQLFEYRYFLYENGSAPRLVGLFSEFVGAAFVTYLTSLDILAVWKADGHFEGSPEAIRAGLAQR